jgi:hypothetical protein
MDIQEYGVGVILIIGIITMLDGHIHIGNVGL